MDKFATDKLNPLPGPELPKRADPDPLIPLTPPFLLLFTPNPALALYTKQRSADFRQILPKAPEALERSLLPAICSLIAMPMLSEEHKGGSKSPRLRIPYLLDKMPPAVL